MRTTFGNDETWIKDDPDGNPSALRFAPGSLVLYKIDNGWVEGEVLKVCQCLEIPPDFRGPTANSIPPILYVVWPHSPVPAELYGSSWIHEDTEAFIRPRLEDALPDPDKFNPILLPPEDPLHYLYSGIQFDPVDEQGNNMADAWRNSQHVNAAETRPDGSIRLTLDGGKDVSAYTMEIPQEPLHGVPGWAIVQIGQQLTRRRPVARTSAVGFFDPGEMFEANCLPRKNKLFSTSAVGLFDPVQMFEANCVPTETSLAQLEEAAQTSNEKMLELAGALMSGVHGWPRDPERGCACYRAAAWGCSEEEELEGRIGIPVGLPEAMVASADLCFAFLKREIMGINLWENVALSRIISAGLQSSERSRDALRQSFYWLAQAAHRGYITPATLEATTAMSEMNLIDDRRIQDDEEMLGFVRRLLQVHQYRELELAFEKYQNNGTIPRGDPEAKTVRTFSTRIVEIFQDMPASDSYSMHLEYRQVPRAPFPWVVYAIRPKQKSVVKVVRLPEDLQYSAFTQESFEYAWHRIAFELHLGHPLTKERLRPTAITVLDTHGNRQFAAFLRLATGDLGTEIRLVCHREPIAISRRRKMPLGEIVKQIETRLIDIPAYLIDERLTSYGASSNLDGLVQQEANELFSQLEENPDQVQPRAQGFKEQGNRLFAARDFRGAVNCYSLTVELLRRLPHPSNEASLLLGTSLSNRAACYIELEPSIHSVAFQKLLVQKAVRDCSAALKSSWASRVLPHHILEKLQFRLDKATARLDVLETDFQSEIADIIFPPPSARLQEGIPPPNTQEDTGTSSAPSHDGPPTPSEQIEVVRSQDASTMRLVETEDLLLEKGHIIHKNTLAKNSNDGCPICLRDFDGELSHILSSVLPCGEHALCVECICRCKKQADKDKALVTCPLCRCQFDGRIVQDLALQIIEKDTEVACFVKKFPADFDESVDAVNRLLWKWDFQVDRVIETIEELLDARATGAFFRSGTDLSPKQKHEIYNSARYPVNCLRDQLKVLIEERRTTFETSKLRSIDANLRKLQSDLKAARIKARDEIYEKLNTVGRMGAQSTELEDTIQVDFHGLHVNEMHSKHKELIEAILPVVKKVTVITGRGLHSADGESKLMRALKKKIEKDRNTRWERIPSNPGAVIVTWIEDSAR